MKTLLLLSTLLLASASADPEEESLTGFAQVMNGNTVRIEGTTIRLWGIAVPGQDRAEGMKATIALFRLIDSKIVSCHVGDQNDREARWGKCEAAGLDISALMVDQGFARDCPAQSNARYHIQEQRARAAGSQIATAFALPSRCERAGAKRKHSAE